MTTNTPSPSHATKKPLKHIIVLALIGACVLAAFLFFRPATHKQVKQDDGKPKTYNKVVYDITSWHASPVMTAQDKFEQIKTLIGATATQEETLDFHGQPAKKYNYSAGHEPPLYVIESDAMFEISWYFAQPKDSDAVKADSIAHAKKAYGATTALYGDDGKAIMATILAGQTAEVSLTKPHHLLKATCHHYTCQLIIQK